MPVASALPRAELLLSSADRFQLRNVTDNFSLTASGVKLVYGPVYVFSQTPAGTAQGFSFYGFDGLPLMTIRTDGVIELRQMYVQTDDMDSFVLAQAPGIYFLSLNNGCTHYLDTNGILYGKQPFVGSVSGLTLDKAVGDFETTAFNVRASSPMQRVVFFGADDTYPILQVLDADNNCVAKFGQDGIFESVGILVPSTVGASRTVYRSFEP